MKKIVISLFLLLYSCAPQYDVKIVQSNKDFSFTFYNRFPNIITKIILYSIEVRNENGETVWLTVESGIRKEVPYNSKVIYGITPIGHDMKVAPIPLRTGSKYTVMIGYPGPINTTIAEFVVE